MRGDNTMRLEEEMAKNVEEMGSKEEDNKSGFYILLVIFLYVICIVATYYKI
jgi:hypothetical protein